MCYFFCDTNQFAVSEIEHQVNQIIIQDVPIIDIDINFLDVIHVQRSLGILVGASPFFILVRKHPVCCGTHDFGCQIFIRSVLVQSAELLCLAIFPTQCFDVFRVAFSRLCWKIPSRRGEKSVLVCANKCVVSL